MEKPLLASEAVELHAGLDAMVTLPALQHHKNSWVPALTRYLKSWLLSIYIVRREIHTQAWKCLDNNTWYFYLFIYNSIFLLWSLLAAVFSDYSFSKATQLKFLVLVTLLLPNTWNLEIGIAVVQTWLGGWKEIRAHIFHRQMYIWWHTAPSWYLKAEVWCFLSFQQAILPGIQQMGLVENYFEGWPCTELLSGEEEMEQELDSLHLREKRRAGCSWWPSVGDLGLLPSW